MAEIASRLRLQDEEALDADNVGRLLKDYLPESTTFVVEAVTASQLLYEQIQPTRPGSWINCGATGIGWSNGAVLGVKMALDDGVGDQGPGSGLVCQVVGDGSFMCAAPSSALLVASRYKIPVLTSTSLHTGWKAPRNSAKLMYPDGLSKSASDEEINISFKPSPNYATLAEAAGGSDGWIKGWQVKFVRELKDALNLARVRVVEERKGLLIEVAM